MVSSLRTKNFYTQYHFNFKNADIRFFYYAGHGIQLGGENYLVPVDAILAEKENARLECLAFSTIFSTFQNSERHAMNIFVMDACRNDPFKNRGWGNKRGADDMGLVLRKTDFTSGSYAAFSADNGQQASDGVNSNNGLYTKILCEELLKPGVEINLLFQTVRGKVIDLSNREQTPVEENRLISDKGFYFIPPVNKPPAENNTSELLRQANALFGKEQYEEAFPLYQQAANTGNVGAQNKLGTCYANGFGVAKDQAQAVHWYGKAAEQGSDGAQYNLGYCYEKGLGVNQDKDQAMAWYQKAAKQGHVAAKEAFDRLILGLLSKALDYSKNEQYEEAFPLFEQAAEKGDAIAQCFLGIYYFWGYGITKDYNQAVIWYKEAADHGSASAQYELGYCYEKGLGVTEDEDQAMVWYKKAAQQEHTKAQEALKRFQSPAPIDDVETLRQAIEYYEHELYDEAFPLFKELAEKGNYDAQIYLGHCYRYGFGVTQDLDQTIIWYKKADKSIKKAIKSAKKGGK